MQAPVVSRAFLCALVAAPALAVAACSAAAERPDFDSEFGAEDGGTGATTGRADDNPQGGGFQGDAGTKVEPSAPGTEIDLDAVEPCDADLSVEDDAAAFLKAIGLCKMAPEGTDEWGVLEAEFVRKVGGGGSAAPDQQHGILPKFGSVIQPREGQRLGVLSTGWAREENQKEYSQGKFRSGESFDSADGRVPTEFSAQRARDLINFRVKLRVPANAKSFSFDFNFHSSEWPSWVGSTKNDHFIAYLTDSANPDGANISFDSEGNPVSVNLTGGLFDRCVPNVNVGCFGENPVTKSTCAGGPEELDGTGFGGRTSACSSSNSGWGGATGWLTTKSPVTGGDEITLEFAIWDADDTTFDSLVLLDNFKWDAEPATVGTDRPVN